MEVELVSRGQHIEECGHCVLTAGGRSTEATLAARIFSGRVAVMWARWLASTCMGVSELPHSNQLVGLSPLCPTSTRFLTRLTVRTVLVHHLARTRAGLLD